MTWEDVLRPCCCLVSNLCPTPCNTMGCGPPGSPCPWNFPGKDTDLGIGPVSPALADGFFTTEPPGKPFFTLLLLLSRFSRVQLCETP